MSVDTVEVNKVGGCFCVIFSVLNYDSLTSCVSPIYWEPVCHCTKCYAYEQCFYQWNLDLPSWILNADKWLYNWLLNWLSGRSV